MSRQLRKTKNSTGLRVRELDSGFVHVRLHYTADPRKDNNWVAVQSAKVGGVRSWKWQKEQEIDHRVAAGQRIWPMLDEAVHIQQWHTAEYLNPAWTLWRSIDHGMRHPCCCAFVAVNAEGTLYVWDEYYKTDAVIAENCENILNLHKEMELPWAGNVIDPSTRQRLLTKPSTIIEEYTRHGLVAIPADNSLAGYDAVSQGLLSSLARWSIEANTVHPKLSQANISRDALFELAKAPAILFHPRCSRIFQEMQNLRFKDRKGDPTQKAAPEKPVDVADEGPDVVRYARQSKAVTYVRPKPKPDVFDVLDQIGKQKKTLSRIIA